MKFDRSKQMQARLHALVPGGCHTYAKGDDQYPQQSPGVIVRGDGAHVWDADGNRFIEYGMGGRAVGLGHNFAPVVAAAREALGLGASFTRPHELELRCAEQVLEAVPFADMVKFTKDGSTATSGAIKLARAVTGRDLVALCHDQPFFSYDDWFIGTTPMDAGIPQPIKDLSVTFPYDDLDALRQRFEQHPGRIACVILEPVKYDDPQPGYLQAVKNLCHEHGALLILDEMICGFRLANAGGQEHYNVEPDLSTFGKAMANGFACSALCGKRAYMQRGGLDHDHERVFLLSTTHGAETHALAATIATIRFYLDNPVVQALEEKGRKLAAGIRTVVASHGLSDYVQVHGKPCNLVYAARDPAGQPSQHYRSLLIQELIRHGVLGPSLVVAFAHTDDDIDHTIHAFDQAMPTYQQALEQGTDRLLVGPPSNIVYRRYNR